METCESAVAVMCGTQVLGTKWPHWHTFLFEGQVAVTRRVVCPQDEKKDEKMLLKQARMVYRKKWAAKRQCEELKEELMLDPMQAILGRKMDRQAPQCNEETRRGRRLGAEKIVRRWLVRRKEVSRMHQRKRHGEAQVLSLPVLEGGQKLGPRKAGQM